MPQHGAGDEVVGAESLRTGCHARDANCFLAGQGAFARTPQQAERKGALRCCDAERKFRKISCGEFRRLAFHRTEYTTHAGFNLLLLALSQRIQHNLEQLLEKFL